MTPPSPTHPSRVSRRPATVSNPNRATVACIIIAAVLLAACLRRTDPVITVPTPDPTQQYGAEQFHIQLTAIATEKP